MPGTSGKRSSPGARSEERGSSEGCRGYFSPEVTHTYPAVTHAELGPGASLGAWHGTARRGTLGAQGFSHAAPHREQQGGPAGPAARGIAFPDPSAGAASQGALWHQCFMGKV